MKTKSSIRLRRVTMPKVVHYVIEELPEKGKTSSKLPDVSCKKCLEQKRPCYLTNEGRIRQDASKDRTLNRMRWASKSERCTKMSELM